MGLNYGATYDQLVVSFDISTYGILHIKARNSDEDTEEGTLDRVTVDTSVDPSVNLPGVYNPGPYDPELPDTTSGLDIDTCIRAVMSQRSDSTMGISLIYDFGPNNRVNVTELELGGPHPHNILLLLDPIHTEIRRREGKVISIEVPPVNQCIVGHLRVKEL